MDNKTEVEFLREIVELFIFEHVVAIAAIGILCFVWRWG